MRVVFFGTPGFALPSLKALLASRHKVVAVVTQPDRPKGRSQELSAPPVKSIVKNLEGPILQPQKLNDPSLLDAFKALLPEVGIVVAYGKLLPRPLLQFFPKGIYNLHASLLPKYRGAAPIQRAVMNGEEETGVTLFQLDEELDHGPILLQERCPLSIHDNAVTLNKKLSERGAQMILKALDQLESGPVKLTPQDESKATYAPQLKKEEGLIDWGLSAQAIANRVRGLQPWPGAYTFWEGKLLKILSAAGSPKRHDPEVTPGAVAAADATQGLWVQTGQGQLRIRELQREGGKTLQAEVFLLGHPLLRGAKLGVL